MQYLSVTGFPSSTSEDLAVTSEASLLSNAPVTDIINVIKVETREAGPVGSQVLVNGSVENLSKKLKEEPSITDQNSEDTMYPGEKQQENLLPTIKEGLKRVCRKDKLTIKNNGKEGFYRLIYSHLSLYLN